MFSSDFILLFCTTALLSSCPCIDACILYECLSVCSCLSWPHTFWTKINRTYKREFSSVFKEASLILDPHTSTSNLMNRHIKYIRQFIQKMGEKNENKKE